MAKAATKKKAKAEEATTLGRPPKWESPEAVQLVVDAFFADCMVREAHPTVSGLALALDLTRQGLLEYQNKDLFSDTIKKAKQRVHVAVEETLMGGKAPVGAIFNLKNNFGWVDKREVDANVEGITMIMNYEGKPQ